LLSHLLETTALRCGSQSAVRWRGGSIAYDRLAEAVRARAEVFAGHGVGPGRAVVLLLPNSPDFVIDFFAIAARGAVAIPLNPQFKPDEVEACLAGCDAAAIVASETASPVAREVASRSGSTPAVFVSSGASGAAAHGMPGELAASQVAGDVLHGFSSGSTGTPNRVVRTQANLVHEAEHFTAAIGLGPEDVIFGAVPFHHAHGFGNCVLAAVRSGATLVIDEAFEPRRALTTIEREGVTVFPGVPFIFRMLAETRPDRSIDMSAMRLCFSAGAALPLQVFEAFDKRFGKPVRQLYGCTEAGSVTINLDPDATGTSGSVGHPMGEVKLEIVDDEGSPLGRGEVGEVVISSPALGRSSAQSESFRGGRFFSGDLGRLDVGGHLILVGRKKLFVSTAAGKVDPVEVERCIAAHPDVEEVVVVAARSRGGDEIVKAVVVPHGNMGDEDGASLRRAVAVHCKERLVAYKVPRRVEVRAEIPRSPLGKVLRKYLV